MASTANSSVALVTGGNKGLGLEIARQLGKKGIRVVIGARNTTAGEKAASELRGEGLDVQSVKLDVTNAADVAALPAFFEKQYGRLDILVNNAGINVDTDDSAFIKSTAATITLERLRRTYETNLFGAVAVTQALLPLLKTSPAGRIVNQSSILGSLTLHADPKSPIYDTKVFGYNSSKTALNAFTVHLAYELKGTKIKVNSAHPGWVKTDMGGDEAPMGIVEGAKTAVELATLSEDGPSGEYFHLGKKLPW